MINDKIRWFFLIPATLLSAILTVIFLGFVAFSLENVFKEEYINIYVVLGAVFVVSAWLLTVYAIAPKHKHSSVWVFYFLGSLLSFVLTCFIYNTGVNEEKNTALVFFFASTIYGLLLSLRLQNKWSLQEFIDKEIKTTHL